MQKIKILLHNFFLLQNRTKILCIGSQHIIYPSATHKTKTSFLRRVLFELWQFYKKKNDVILTFELNVGEQNLIFLKFICLFQCLHAKWKLFALIFGYFKKFDPPYCAPFMCYIRYGNSSVSSPLVPTSLNLLTPTSFLKTSKAISNAAMI